MLRSHPRAGVIGKMAHLALLGVGILILGPIVLSIGLALVAIFLGLFSAFLPFIVIGALAYGPYVLVRRTLGYPRTRLALRVRPFSPPAVPIPPQVRRFPPKLPVPPAPPIMQARREPAPKRWRSIAARVAAEVFCGGLVGGILASVALIGISQDWTAPLLIERVAMGAGIGAIVGFVVGGPRPAASGVEQTSAAA
jgi:hypothetical protein